MCPERLGELAVGHGGSYCVENGEEAPLHDAILLGCAGCRGGSAYSMGVENVQDVFVLDILSLSE